MGFFEVILIAGGVLTLGTILAAFVSPGVAEVLGQFISFLVSSFQMFVQFLLDHTPKPIRVVMFLVAIAAFGGLLYSATIGSQYVCFDDDVYKTDVFTGWSVKILPGIQTSFKEDPELDEAQNIRPTNLSSVESDIEYTGTKYRSVDVVDSNFARESTLQWRHPNGDRYEADVWYFVVGAGDVLWLPSLDDIFLRDEEDVLNTFFPFDEEDYQYALYQVCADKTFSTCTLQRTTVLGGNSCGAFEKWNQPVGTLYYFYERDTNGDATFSVKLDDEWGGGHRFWEFFGVNAWSLSDCSEVSPSADDYEDAEWNAVDRAILEIPPIIVQVDESDGNIQYPMSLPLYDAQYAALFTAETPRNLNQQFFNLSEQPPEIEDQRDFSKVESKNQDVVREALSEAELVQESSVGYDVVTFSCDDSTENEYDTQMKVMGINPFDPLLLVFVFVIGAIGVIYGRLGVFR